MIRWTTVRSFIPQSAVLFAAAIFLCLGLSSCSDTTTPRNTTTSPTTIDSPPTTQDVNLAETKEKLRSIEANPNLPKDVKSKAVSLYQQALKDLSVSATWREKSAKYETMLSGVGSELQDVRTQLAAPTSRPGVALDAETVSSLKEKQLDAKLQAAETEESLTALEKEIEHRATRQREVPLQLESARKRMTQLETPAEETGKESPEVADARRIARKAQLQAVGDEIQALGRELPAYEAQNDLLLAKQELLTRKSKTITRRLDVIRNAIEKKQTRQAAAVVAEARREANRVDPELTAMAQENVSLADQLAGDDGVSARLRKLNDTIQSIEKQLAEVRQRSETLKQQETIIGLSEAMGVLLMRYRADLPNPAYWKKQIRANHPRVDKVQLNRLKLKDELSGLEDIPARTRKRVHPYAANLTPEKERELTRQATKLLETHRGLLTRLLDDTNEYFQKLLVQEELLQRLEEETETLRDYIEERILWTRSASLLGVSSGPNIREELKTLLRPDHWRVVIRVGHKDIREHPVAYGFLIVIVVALLTARRIFQRGIDNTQSPNVAAPGTKGMFRQTILALILTLLLAAPLPVLLWVLSWRLGVAPTESTFPGAVAAALYPAGVVLAVLCVLLNLCRPRGLAEVHFHWSAETNTLLRRYIRYFTAAILPLVFLVVLANEQSQIVAVSSLGRLLLILGLAVVTVFCALAFRPHGPLGNRWYRTREGMLFRLRYIWYGATVLLPAAMMVLAWVGYYALALRLTWEMTITSWFIVGLLLLNGLLLRWLTLLFYAITARRKRRTAEKDAGLDVDVSTLRAQSRRVLRFVIGVVLVLGLWGIWADSLPTLRLLGRVELWNTTDTVSVETVDKEGKAISQTEQRIEPVTVEDAVVAVVILILTFVAARSAAGLLRVLILRRLTTDNGAKYAITVLVRYAIGVIGLVVALGLLGLRWGSIQWLVAAATVGLGFGLQEIFANFVSGLIILFERPIRIGDTVTVGDTVGTVTRLRIRATTITDWDRKELIVPNREFISNRMVNWTLSDKILRVILRVGVAYGSDTELAERLLREVAENQPLILNHPEPVVLFTGFGDNALQFELRVYIRGIEHYLRVWHETNMAIDKTFRENHITIAFPQRDTHLDTSSPLDIRILPAENNPKPGK